MAADRGARRPLRAALRDRLHGRRRRPGDRGAAAGRAAAAGRRRPGPARLAAVAGRVRDADRSGSASVAGIITLVVDRFYAGFSDLAGQVERRASARSRTSSSARSRSPRGRSRTPSPSCRRPLVDNQDTITSGALDHRRHRRRGRSPASCWRCSRCSSSSRTAGRSGCGWSACSPQDSRAYVDEAARRSWRTLISYVRATVAVALVDAVGIGDRAGDPRRAAGDPAGRARLPRRVHPDHRRDFLSGSVAVLVALVVQGPGHRADPARRRRRGHAARGPRPAAAAARPGGPGAPARRRAGDRHRPADRRHLRCADRRPDRGLRERGRHLPQPPARRARGRPSRAPSGPGRRSPRPSRDDPCPRTAASAMSAAQCAAGQVHAGHPLVRGLRGRRRGRRRCRPRRRTRPPLDTTAPSSRRRVPACRTPGRSAPVSRSAGARRLRVARRGDHDGHRGAVAPAQRRVRRRACRSRRRAAGRRAASPAAASTTWVSGSPNRALNSTTRSAARGEREADVQQAGERSPRGGPSRRGSAAARWPAPRRPGRAAPTAAARRRPCRRCSGRCRRRRRRLSSWAGSSGRTVVPSVTANRDTSGPSRYSSTNRTAGVEHAVAVGDGGGAVVGDDDALAGGQAVVLDHVRRARPRPARSPPRRGPPTGQDRAVGTPAAAITCLAKDLLPSSWAASADGPKQAIPASRTASAAPATSGTSGPITTRSAAQSAATRGHGVGVRDGDGERLGDRAVPALPGAQTSALTAGSDGESHAQGVLPGTGTDHEHAHGSRI